MGKVLAIVSLIAFVIIQLVQGLWLDLLLCARGFADWAYWLGLALDGVLLLLWTYWFLCDRTVGWNDIGCVPLIAIAYSLNVLTCLLPRLVFMVHKHRNIQHSSTAPAAYTNNNNSCVSSLNDFTAWFDGSLNIDPLVGMLTITMPTILVALVVAIHAEHGLSAKFSLRYNTVGLLFAIMDGLGLLQVALEDVELDRSEQSTCIYTGPDLSNMRDVLSAVDTLSQSCTMAVSSLVGECGAGMSMSDNSTSPMEELQVTSPMEELQLTLRGGVFGNYLIATAMFAFMLPLVGLWQMKRESRKLRSDEKLRKQVWSRILLQAESGHLRNPQRKPNGRKRNRKQMLRSGGKRLRTLRTKPQSKIRRHARKRVHKEKETYRRVERDIRVLHAVYALWDFFLINLPGLIIRLCLLFKYRQRVSVLVIKNSMSVLAAMIEFTVHYVQPWYRRLRRLDVGDHDGDGIPDLQRYALQVDGDDEVMAAQATILSVYQSRPSSVMVTVVESLTDNDLVMT